MSDTYQLYYWPFLPGRGEFVRLVLEEARAPYEDVARRPKDEGGGFPAIIAAKTGELGGCLPYAPPILVAGELVLSQTANICSWLGERHALVPEDEATRLAARQLQMTIADVVGEAHNTHHPLSSELYFEEQREAAVLAAANFVDNRIPKYLGYFTRVIEAHGGDHLLGQFTYVDLALYQLTEGLLHAFPKGMARSIVENPAIEAHRQQVGHRPAVLGYMASDRRMAFNAHGVFRHYPELDH